MKLEYYPIEKLKKEVLNIVGEHLDLSQYRVFFFGSRISGKAGERSDIDIGIEGPKEIPIEIKFKIEEEIEKLPTLYKIEIVDFKDVAPKFKKVALQDIELITK